MEKDDFEIPCFVFLQWKTKLETLLKFELHFNPKKSYRNINYRKLQTILYRLAHTSGLLQEKLL